MDTDPVKITVLDDDAHGIPAAEYAETLRDRLPDAEVSLAKTPPQERRLVPDATVVTGATLGEDLIADAGNLRLFACRSAGVDHLPLETFEEHGVAVTNASGIHGPNVAEHVLGWLLMFTRRLDEGLRRQKRREWRRYPSFGELTGKTVTVVLLGAIGEAVAERLEGFGVGTIGVRYTPEKGGPTDEVIGFDRRDLLAALAETDFLVLACPLTETTEGLIGATELGVLPTDAVVVNVARGPVVDTPALVETLRDNRLHGAGLDVTDPEPLPEGHPLWGFENVFITPHAAGHTPRCWERLADIVAENVETAKATGEYDGLRNQIV